MSPNYEKEISQLEQGGLSPQDAEKTVSKILIPLLSDDGYEVSQTPLYRDSGVDFLANKHDGAIQEKLAIEYKHYRSPVSANVIQRLIGASVVHNFDRLMLVTNSRFTRSALEIANSNLPVKLELIDLDSLKAWVQRAEKTENYDFKLVNILRSSLSDRLAKAIAQNPRYLMDIEWRELERVVQVVFEELGFSAELTPGSKDGGKDVILKCRISGFDHTYFIELKHWRSQQKVGGQAAQDFLKVIMNEEVNGGLFLSSYGYCDNAFEMLTEIDRQYLKFGNQEKIVTLCKQYVKSKSGIWSPTDGLANVLFEQTV
ncbi:endonuclease [Photobacterium kishitanii]|uniref:Restriction endonuclease n=2 Tax=Photobacterium kishitanii TaxID=318456 RepID=A0AAX0YTW3_9GAMM|nr:endonuclease [Photobacterium kishitanii]KJG56902.1 endonuclease [Photobacterium kishitanii]KJG63438.1 endonuclease [Photobacterium kishitanii]KJG65516.1 endonuclease [Photobacterium kishitanii]PSX18387.1 restriction endonuclease [Photobacterium kishitanii]